jgi:hypothetical protein
MHHQQISMAHLFKILKPGGIYVVEDLFTSHPQPPFPPLGFQLSEADTRTLDMLIEFNETGKMNSIFMTEEEQQYLQDNIASCTIHKARESEIKNAVGSANRAQQAYHWEKATFAQGADDQESLRLLNLSVGNRYIDSFSIVGNATVATIAPTNLNFALDQTKAYSGSVFYLSGLYEATICVSLEPVVSISPPPSEDSCGVNQLIQ